MTLNYLSFLLVSCQVLFGAFSIRIGQLPDRFKNAILFGLATIILILICALRPIGLDPDSKAYEGYYESKFILLLAEPTFALISYIVKALFNDFRYVIVVYAILGVTIKAIAISKLTELKFLSLIVYIGSYFILHEYTQVRAGVATGLLLLSIIPLSERKMLKFYLFVLLAVLFHYSSLILLPFYLLTNKELSKTWKLVLYLLIPVGISIHLLKMNIFVAIPLELVQTKMNSYKDAQETAVSSLNVFNSVYLIKYLTFYILLYFYSHLTKYSKYLPILLKLYGISLFAYLSLSQNTIFAMRISELVGVVEIILIPYLYYVLRERWASWSLVFIIGAVSLYINIFYVVLTQEI